MKALSFFHLQQRTRANKLLLNLTIILLYLLHIHVTENPNPCRYFLFPYHPRKIYKISKIALHAKSTFVFIF